MTRLADQFDYINQRLRELEGKPESEVTWISVIHDLQPGELQEALKDFVRSVYAAASVGSVFNLTATSAATSAPDPDPQSP